MSALFPPARDAAQQIVTALIHGDRDTAVDIAQDFHEPLLLALVLGDLCAYTHYRWSRHFDLDTDQREGAWAALLTDVEEWRLTKESS